MERKREPINRYLETFDGVNPLRLSTEMEADILELALANKNFIDNGSSRAVYGLNDYLVVKLAIDEGGIHQNLVELETFLNNPKGPLARLYAYGEFVVVMEIVKVIGYTNVENALDIINEECEFEINEKGEVFDERGKILPFTFKEMKKIDETVTQLHEIFGYSEDNFQLGFGSRGVVSFDYGYIPEDHEISISKSLTSKICEIGEWEILREILDELRATIEVEN